MKSEIGKRDLQQTPLKIVAAYDYADYSVVTTEAIGWFGCDLDEEPTLDLTTFPTHGYFRIKKDTRN